MPFRVHSRVSVTQLAFATQTHAPTHPRQPARRHQGGRYPSSGPPPCMRPFSLSTSQPEKSNKNVTSSFLEPQCRVQPLVGGCRQLPVASRLGPIRINTPRLLKVEKQVQ